jgi:hypothetical protein
MEEYIMRLGVQFTGSVAANSTRRWFTHSWPAAWRVLWLVAPTQPVQDHSPQLEYTVQVEKQTSTLVKYFIKVKNISSQAVSFEARYAIMD